MSFLFALFYAAGAKKSNEKKECLCAFEHFLGGDFHYVRISEERACGILVRTLKCVGVYTGHEICKSYNAALLCHLHKKKEFELVTILEIGTMCELLAWHGILAEAASVRVVRFRFSLLCRA